MSVHSAGILLYRFRGDKLEVFLVHPGGPFWSGRDEAAWSIPKGLVEDGEADLQAAQREFKEETGFDVTGRFIDLGQLRQPSQKIVHAWAVEQDVDERMLKSNTFTLEWPKGSGAKEYPEVDQGGWFSVDMARRKMHKGQVRFLDRLLERLVRQDTPAR